MFAPVWQTMPAISIEYHRALKRTGMSHMTVIQYEQEILCCASSVLCCAVPYAMLCYVQSE